MPSEYDISRAFKRIEDDLMESMMRNLKRHQVEEKELGMTWEQWQAEQLRELEEYRLRNADKFTDDFKSIDRKVDELYRETAKNAQSKEEASILDKIKKRQFTPDKDKGGFFRLNEGKLEALIMATKSDFARAEFALLRRANDQYRKIIFDSMVYANVTNDYKKAVDMATHDFLKAGINCVVYKNGARHTIADYASMALRTGNKRAYLMGEGNAHAKYGLHIVRVNNRTNACPLCVGFLGKLLIDDVYAGGTQAEADQMGIPTLSDAMLSGFLHPNCKDMYSVYIPGVSKGAKPWSAEEIEQITEDYNTEQKIKYAQDTADTYARMAKYSLDPDNVAKYEAKAKEWQAKADELKGDKPKPIEPTEPPVEPVDPPVEPPTEVAPFTEAELEALEYYVSGDGMWLNNYLRGIETEGAILPDTLDAETQRMLDGLLSATDRPLEADKLYRSVDASVIFSGMSEDDLYHMIDHIMYGEGQYDKGAYSQGIKARMEKALEEAKGKEITEKGFMSTTVDKNVAVEWGDFTGAEHPVVIEFDTAGVNLRGADLDFLDIAEDPQRERLLAPNVQYKITDIGVAETEDGMRYIKVNATIIDQGETAVETAVAETTERAFVPATTIEEAEEFAKRFTDTGRFGAVGISYEGVSVDVANIVNKTIDDFFATFDVEPFGGIIAPKGNTRMGKLVDGATAGYSPVRHSFILNRKSLKSVAVAEKGLREERALVTKILANPEKYDLSKVGTVVRKTIENAVISGRGTVPMTIEEVLWHELGHTLERGVSKAPNFERIKANMAVYAPKVSGYATTEMGEYIAESFCSYMKGEGVADPELIKAFEALRR